MPLPDFLIIGSQKAGTTSLHEVLKRHPEVHMAEPKDMHFFSREHLYRRGLSFYEARFETTKVSARIRGEASVSYVCHPGIAERIRNHLPEVRLVLTVRNPVKRAYSQYWHGRRNLTESRSFEELIDCYPDTEYVPGRPGHVSRGFYMTYIDRFLEHFQRERLLVLLTDDLVKESNRSYRRLFRFLGVDESFTCPEMGKRANPARIHANPLYRFFLSHPRACARLPQSARRLLRSGRMRPFQYPPMRPKSRRLLTVLYREANNRLADFLERDLDYWNE